jgi:cytidyltransferase-like protein
VILSPDELVWLRDKNCVLLDGAFDPLHAGHVRYFTDAIKAFPSSLLVVGVASDDDIRAKGREPLFDQQTRCTVAQAVMGRGYAIAKDGPTEHLISRLKPAAYVKGADWKDKLPDEQLAACSLNGVQIVFLNTVTDSSSGALRRWALRDAERGLDRLETFIANQAVSYLSPPTFDRNYFLGDWRGDAPFTFEARKKAEGRHPKIVKEVFDGLNVLDVGCGPGHFVRMLRELGVDAGGIDPSKDAVALSNGIADRVVHAGVADMPAKIAQVVICREVLEHVPVTGIGPMVSELFRVARKFVYITTRFSEGSVFDAATDFDTDPTHVTCLTQPFLRSLCVLNGGRRRRDLETTLDHQNKGRVLVYEVH